MQKRANRAGGTPRQHPLGLTPRRARGSATDLTLAYRRGPKEKSELGEGSRNGIIGHQGANINLHQKTLMQQSYLSSLADDLYYISYYAQISTIFP